MLNGLLIKGSPIKTQPSQKQKTTTFALKIHTTMYEHRDTPFGKMRRHTLFNPKTRNGFSLVPARGATLLSLEFGGYNVLDGYAQPEELSEMDWMKNTVLFPFPNRLNSGRYTWLGQPHQMAMNDATTQNALHGFGLWQKFTVVRLLLTEVAAEITCRLEDNGKNAGYPFPTTL